MVMLSNHNKDVDVRVEACNDLFDLLPHLSGGGKQRGGAAQTVLHDMIKTNSNSIGIANALLDKAADLDRANAAAARSAAAATAAAAGKKQPPHGPNYYSKNHHVRSLLLSPEAGSHYTPLHAALYERNLIMTLFLLRRASIIASASAAHPMFLLDGGDGRTKHLRHKKKKCHTNHMSNHILLDLVLAKDAEGLTPLELLSKTMILDLFRCRRHIQMYMCSSALERDRSSSILEEEEHQEEQDERDGVSFRTRMRMRGTSFGDVHHFHLDHDNENDNDNHVKSLSSPQSLLSSSTYGCEVMTFGQADPCALGVPHFANRKQEGGGGAPTGTSEGVAAKMATASVRPRRVEAFALGEMGRNFDAHPTHTNDNDNRSQSQSHHERERDQSHHGAAIAVAAAAHHTLVATAKGYLMAFGLGKGGRLGVGDEGHRPLPTRVLGPLQRRKVVSIAAAINHSLCVTSDGDIFSWGSNRFGQLGISSSSSSGKKAKPDPIESMNTDDSSARCLPRRITDLKREFVVSVAAGDRHSVALTRHGQVFCWGDNKAGQLGIARGSSNSGGTDRPTRVDALWNASPGKRVSKIAAAEHSTLVIVLPPRFNDSTCSGVSALPINSVYSWGHGNHHPVKVNFPTPGDPNDTHGVTAHYGRKSSEMTLNPTDIATAKHHSVAIMSNGMVYAWGIHAEPLGGMAGANDQKMKRASSVGSMVIAAPQLVTGMLPENGGGHAVAISASENHTAVITDSGTLFTWGANEKSNVLGHEGVKWQPTPRRVHGVHRAVGLAAAKEHTVLLIGTAFPSLPDPKTVLQPMNQEADYVGANVPSLQDIAAREVARYVDLFSVLQILIHALRIRCNPLISFCTEFVQRNLDAVLALGKKAHLNMLLDESICDTPLLDSDYDDARDGNLHPVIRSLAMIRGDDWIKSSLDIFKRLPDSTLAKRSLSSKKNEHCFRVDMKGSDVAGASIPAIRDSPKPSLVQVEVQATNEELQEQVPTKIPVCKSKSFTQDNAAVANAETVVDKIGSSSRFRCDLCKVTCPDHNSYSMHIGGKKHRNRVRQDEKDEIAKAAADLMDGKRRQMLTNEHIVPTDYAYAKPKAVKSPWQKDTNECPSGDRLKPPPSKIYESETLHSTPLKRSVNPPTWTPKKPASFQDILKEEGRASLGKKSPSRVGFAVGPATAASALPSSLWAVTPPKSAAKSARLSSGVKKISLGSFLEPKRQPIQKYNGPAWAAAETGSIQLAPSVDTRPTAPQKESLHEIQRNEEALKANQDRMCDTLMDGKWYVERRERSDSIAAIQEREAEEMEMRLLIEEQIAIEEQISRDREQQQQQQERKETPKSTTRSRKSGGNNKQQRKERKGGKGQPSVKSGNRSSSASKISTKS